MWEWELLKQRAGYVRVVPAPNFTDASDPYLMIGVSARKMEALIKADETWWLGQLHGIVKNGLVGAQHIFQGLRREMYVEDNMQADEEKLAFSWSPRHDVRLDHDTLKLHFCDPPRNRVFVVYISPNKVIEDFPDIFGWAEHWAWVVADPSLPGAPVEWDTRYDRKLWSRESHP